MADNNDKQKPSSKGPKLVHDAFMEHQEVLSAYLAQFVTRHEDVEDILQETYISSVEASRDRKINSPRSYLFIVARNLIFKQLRVQSKRVIVDISSIDESEMISPEMPADETVYHKAQLEVFIEAAGSLPKQCRRVFLMRKLKGMSHRAIASELRISTSTVERHITTALTRCQDIMSKRGYGMTRLRAVEPSPPRNVKLD